MFVKLGQVASSRTDLFPPSCAPSWRCCGRRWPPRPPTEAKALFEEELGAPVTEVFARFEWEPMASASIAQVYAAVLHDGTEVVVKVERPGIDDVVDRDSAVLRQLATGLERHTTLGLTLSPRSWPTSSSSASATSSTSTSRRPTPARSPPPPRPAAVYACLGVRGPLDRPGAGRGTGERGLDHRGRHACGPRGSTRRCWPRPCFGSCWVTSSMRASSTPTPIPGTSWSSRTAPSC